MAHTATPSDDDGRIGGARAGFRSRLVAEGNLGIIREEAAAGSHPSPFRETLKPSEATAFNASAVMR